MFSNFVSDLIPALFLVLCYTLLLLQPWLSRQRDNAQVVAAISLFFSMLSAMWLNKVETWVVIPLGSLFLAAWLSRHATSAFFRHGMNLATIVLAFAIASHGMPGFHFLPWFENVVFSEQAAPFTLLAHWDKPWAGAVLMLAHSPLSKGVIPAGKGAILAITASLVIIATGPIAGVPFEPKWQPVIAVFWLHNLFFTCMAEEMFFRQLLQLQLHHVLSQIRFGNIMAIFLTSAIFAVAHFHPDTSMSTLALIAIGGTVYACVFHVTRAVHWSILVHFLTNALHIVLLRYPLT